MAKPRHSWMVRAGDDNELAGIVEQENVIAIGWMEMGNVSNLRSREGFKERYRQVYPEHSSGRVAVNAGQIYRLAQEIQEGDHGLLCRTTAITCQSCQESEPLIR